VNTAVVTPFSFEHTFRAPSVDALIAAYFDRSHLAEQDRNLDIAEREILELEETPERLRRVSRVVPRRQLPALVRPFTSGPLHYRETVVWHRGTRELAIVIEPSLMRGRARIEATYRLELVGPGTVQRRYSGQVSVDVALLAQRIEAGIVAEFSRSMPLAAACTQAWLDQQSVLPRSVTAPTTTDSGTALT
jgi:hypothetical protein